MAYLTEQKAVVGFLTMDELKAFEGYLALEGIEGFKRCAYRMMHAPTVYALRYHETNRNSEVLQVGKLMYARDEPYNGFYAFVSLGEDYDDIEEEFGESEKMEENSIYAYDFLWLERTFGEATHEPLDLT